jgi:hypothetical protein
MTNVVHDVDGRSCFTDRKSVAGKNLAVTFGVQVGKSVTEFNLFPIYFHGTPGAFASDLDFGWAGILVDA